VSASLKVWSAAALSSRTRVDWYDVPRLNDNRVERRAVRLGARVANGQIVLSGVSAGARVAAGDLSQLADGARVRVAN